MDLWDVPLLQSRRQASAACRLLAHGEMRSVETMAEPHRSRWLVARASLRIVLSAYVGVSPGEIQLVYGPWGKPALEASTASQGLEFNLSKSNDSCLVAVTRIGPVGVDIESVAPVPRVRELARRFFAPSEAAVLEAQDDEGRLPAFLRYWTAKEACAKALGRGLSLPLPAYLVPEEFLHRSRVRLTGLDGGRWVLVQVDPGSDVVGSLAVKTDADDLIVSKRTLESELVAGWMSDP